MSILHLKLIHINCNKRLFDPLHKIQNHSALRLKYYTWKKSNSQKKQNL